MSYAAGEHEHYSNCCNSCHSGLTPELSRAATRPRRWSNHSWPPSRPRSGLGLSELLDRSQPGLLPENLLLDLSSQPNTALSKVLNPETECRRSCRHGVCGEALMRGGRREQGRQAFRLLTAILPWCGLTPELSRTAARHGVMVHGTI